MVARRKYLNGILAVSIIIFLGITHDTGDSVCVAAMAAAGITTNYNPLSPNRTSTEMTTQVINQNGTCYWPPIDTSAPHTGTGVLKIDVPIVANQGNGGGADV